MSEADVARIQAMIEALHKRIDKLECALEKSSQMMHERDDEIHIIMRDMALDKQRESTKLEHCEKMLEKILAHQATMDEEHRIIVAQVKNMNLIFRSAQWFLITAIPILLSSAVGMFFVQGGSQ